MKKSLTRKLTIAVIALVFAVVSLSTSTYAWFTMSNEADIQAFDATVKAGQGIEIAVTAAKDRGNAPWYTGTVPSDDIQAIANPNHNTFKFDAVNPTNLSFDGFTYSDIKGDAIDNSNKGWIEFYVHIKSAEAGKIYLDQITLDSEANTWTVDAPFKVAAANAPTDALAVNSQIEYAVENAARVSLTKLANNNPVNYIYEKDAEDYVAASTSGEGESVVNTPAKAGNTEGFGTAATGALNYYNVKNPTATVLAKTANYEAKKLSALDDRVNGESVTKGMELLSDVDANGEITLLVSVWIEGWDAECLNAIFGQKLSVSIEFYFQKN